MKSGLLSQPFLACIWFLTIVIHISSCKKNSDNNLVITGKVKSGQSGLVLNGVTVSLEKKSVQGSTYSAVFTSAAATTSGGSGEFELTFPRENFSDLRLVASKAGYLTRYFPISPTSITPGSPYITIIDIFERSEVSLNIRSVAPFDQGDRLNFTFIKTSFDCACCGNGWKIFDATNLDTTLNCLAYGNRWIEYEVQRYGSQSDTIYRDSVFCPTESRGEIYLTY